VARAKRPHALLNMGLSMTAGESTFLAGSLPTVDEGWLRRRPCIRLSDFLPPAVAEAVELEVASGLVYERVELGGVTAQWRAMRPLGDVYFGPMKRRAGWVTPGVVAEALAFFESAEFVAWLSKVAGEQLRFLRPVTAYRLSRGDRICLHDDMSEPDHAVSVAYNLSRAWAPEAGGQTIFGHVKGTTPLPTPVDSPIPLRRWEITDTLRFAPQFNSLLIMRLGEEFAHGVEPVTGHRVRFSLVGIYGRG
jgi:hypothetical protein